MAIKLINTNQLSTFLILLMTWSVFISKGLLASPFDVESYRTFTVDEKLAFIDNYRLKKPQETGDLLSELFTYKDKLSLVQQDYLQLLLALRHLYKGELLAGLKVTSKLLEKQDNLDIEIFNRALKFNINVALINRDWSFGFDNIERILSITPQLSNDTLKQDTFVIVAMFYNRLNEHQFTLEYINKVQAIKLTEKNSCVVARLYAEANLKLASIAPHDYQVSSALTTCEKKQMYIWSGFLRTLIARMHIDADKPNEALGQLIPYLRDLENTNYPNLIAEVYSAMAQAYWQKLNIERAERFALKAVEVGNHIASTEPMVDTYQLLYKIEKQKGNIDAALQYHELYAEADKRYLDELSAKSTAFQLAQHKASQQQSEIALLNQQNEILNNHNALLNFEQKITQRDAENSRIITSLLLAIVTLLTFFGYRSWRIQRRLRTLAQHDFLTKVHNRGYFMSQAEQMLAQAEKANQIVTCIIFDLDKFKEINDSFGHTTGDWALETVASTVKKCIRKQDLFARLGGEEFIILLPNCDIQAASYVADKCAAQLTDIDTAATGHKFMISASFGVSNSALSGYEITKLISHTDDAMYQAKDGGRNQVSFYQHTVDKEQLPLQLN